MFFFEAPKSYQVQCLDRDKIETKVNLNKSREDKGLYFVHCQFLMLSRYALSLFWSPTFSNEETLKTKNVSILVNDLNTLGKTVAMETLKR